MKIPKTIKVGGIVFDVKLFEPCVPPLCRNHADGQTDFEACSIVLDSKLNNRVMGQVLLHEIIHIIEYNANLESTESYIQTIASGLYQVLKDNNLLKE